MTIIKKFQPYDFDFCTIDEECGIREPECWQIARITDPASIQFGDPTPFLGADIIVDGDFTAGTIGTTWFNIGVGNDWTDVANTADVSADSKYLYQGHSISTCDCFKLVFDLLDALESDCNLYFVAYDGVSWTVIESWKDIAAQNDIELGWCASQDFTHIGFALTGTNCDGAKAIDNVRMYPFTPKVRVQTCEGVIIDTISDCDINVYEEHWNIVISSWDDYITENGCYKICIEDIEYVIDGNFTMRLTKWKQTETTWDSTLTAPSRASAVLNAGDTSGKLYQEVGLPAKCEPYTLTFTLSAAGGGGASYRMDLYINGIVVESYTTLGAKTYTIDANVDVDTIGFAYYAIVGNDTYEITSISILGDDICSKCFCIDDHDCSLLLSGTQTEDARDFMFDDNFTFWMRISAELLNSNPIYTENIGRKSTGEFDLRYGDIVNSKDLTVYTQPNYIWNALYRLMLNNDWRIDGTGYIKKEGDPEVTFKDNFGEGVVEVIKRSQLHRN